jgi:uncharacterized membrane protein required for colicin V production
MQTTDIILLIFLLWGACWGFYKGLISQLSSLVGIFIAFYVSVKYCTPFANLINNHIDSKMSRMYIGSLNHIAGGLFGLIKWAFILSFTLFLIAKFGEEIGHSLINFHDTWLYNHIEMIASATMRKL